MFDKTQYGAIPAVNVHGGFFYMSMVTVQTLRTSDSNRIFAMELPLIAPHRSKVWKVPYHDGILVTTVCDGTQHVRAATDIVQLSLLQNTEIVD